MNVNQLIKRIKDELGLSRFLNLSFTDHDIYDIIVHHTMPDWGRYFKHEIEFTNVEFGNQNKIGPDLYVIPKSITDTVKRSDLEIIDLKECRFGYFGITSGVGSYVANYGYDMDTSGLFGAVYDSHRNSSTDMNVQHLHKCFFEKPNHLRFVFSDVNIAPFTVALTFFVSQAPNLNNVSPTREHDFLELAKLNTQIILYQNEGKYIESLASGLGNINLKIDDWASATERKAEFLTRLLEYSHIHEAPSGFAP